MSGQREVQLIEKLLAKTRAGFIDWERTADEDIFLGQFDEYLLRLRRGPRGFMTKIWLDVSDAKGKNVTTLAEDDVPAMNELFLAARRSATGQDQAFDDLLRKLG